ncbi:MAG: arginine--tRNA ligase [Nanoarchaeota archaeon]
MDFEKKILSLLKKNVKGEIALEVPPDNSLGDYAFPCFSLAKMFKKNPQQIAQELAKKLKADFLEKVEAKGPYVNFFLSKPLLVKSVLMTVLKKQRQYGKGKNKKKIVIEYPSPNTNKPLHLGHIRNILLGSTLTRLFQFQGNKVYQVNLNNDRGIHICKSMLAYQKWGVDKKPDKKPDHFVGDWYVKYSQELQQHPELEQEAQEMLRRWEVGDKIVRALWKKMNRWALQGFHETYVLFNLKFDKEYFESGIYEHGKQLVLDHVKKGIFEKDQTGAVIARLEKEGLDNKVLLRSDGTSVYMTQDLYLAQLKYENFKMDQSIYVVGNEQNYHFKVLFILLKKLKVPFADQCYHLSYGMVFLPEGKMKSREGNVVDADDLVGEMIELARAAVKKRWPDLKKQEIEKRAKAIGMAALRFHILKYDPASDITFNPAESISFEGETGPYLQYCIARINSIFRKHGKDVRKADLQQLVMDQEYQLAKLQQQFPAVVAQATEQYKIHLLTRYLLDLSKAFSSYYEHYPILQAEPNIRDARLLLCKAVREVLSIGLSLLDIAVLEEM